MTKDEDKNQTSMLEMILQQTEHKKQTIEESYRKSEKDTRMQNTNGQSNRLFF